MITCIACVVQRRAVGNAATPDIVAIGVLAYAWKHERTIEELCRGLCDQHTEIFKGGVIAAERVEKEMKCEN